MLKQIFLASFILVCTMAFAQKEDKKLKALVEQDISGFQGDVGIYIHHLKRNRTVSIHADTVFPTASIIKVPILAAVFNKISQGELKLSQEFIYDTGRVYGGSGLMQFFKDSARTDLSTMISLMLTYSDNVAAIWLQQLAGGGAVINPLMDQLGLINTKVNSRTAGREEIWKKYGWGQTTPREMAMLFTMIREGKLIDARYADKMYRYLKNQFYNGRSLSQLPPTVNTICKTGSVDAARGEVLLVNAPGGDFVCCMLTKNNKDQSWTANNEAENLIRKLAHTIWNYFEPKHAFTAFDKID